jgi:5'-3' exoribonuclease 2
VGNDFLPHLPSLKIRDGAIDLLMQKYKLILPTLDGYLTHNGDVNLQRVERLLIELAELEDGILRAQREREMRQRVCIHIQRRVQSTSIAC